MSPTRELMLARPRIWPDPRLSQSHWALEVIEYSNHLNAIAFPSGAPTIVPSPDTVHVQIERTATLPCRAAGIPKPKVHWLKNNKPISELAEKRYNQLPDDSLLIKGTFLNVKCKYSCKFKMSNWKISKSSPVLRTMSLGNSESICKSL